MRRHIFVLLACMLLLPSMAGAAAATDRGGDRGRHLELTTTRAPVGPDGLTAGAPTDFLVNFRDPDPAVPGIALKEGAMLRLRLPSAFTNTGAPVGADCTDADPICSDAVIVQGWPQSPILPFPDITHDEATNTFTATMTVPFPANPPVAPGPKTLHLTAFGFNNPERPGRYPIELEIQPDPDSPATFTGRTTVRIMRRVPAQIAVNSTVNGAPPPPFPNAIYQTAERDGGAPIKLLTYGFNLWGADAEPLVGTTIDMRTRRFGLLRDADNHPIGIVWIRAPRRARDFELVGQGPAEPANVPVTGIETGLLKADFSPDPDVAGDYTLRFRLFGGNTQRMFVSVE